MKNKIIVINSFKGGAAKTTVSLSYAVTAAADMGEEAKVYYIDLDILGTGSQYLLYNDKGFPKTHFGIRYNDQDIDKYFDKYTFFAAGKPKSFYAACIDAKTEYSYINNEKKLFHKYSYMRDNLFADCVEKMIKSILEQNKKEENAKPSIIVLDCSPGFDERETEILKAMRRLSDGNNEVIEVFASTTDCAHLKKTKACLKNYYRSEDKTRYLVVSNMDKLEDESEKNLNEAIARMEEDVKDLGIKIFKRAYNKNIRAVTLYGQADTINNNENYDYYMIVSSDEYETIVKGRNADED